MYTPTPADPAVFTSSPAVAAASAAMFLGITLGLVALTAVIWIATWRMYTKAGQPGWASIVPFYNTYILLKMAGRPGWWLVLYFVPIVSIVITLLVAIELAKVFGRSSTFGVVGLWLFSGIGYLILGFGKDQYQGPAELPPAAPTPAPVVPAAV